MRRALLSGGLVSAGLGMVLFCAACGDGSGASASDDEQSSAHIDNCALVTDAEASSLGGFDLKHGEDSLLGCPFTRTKEGSVNGELTVEGSRGKGPAKDKLGTPSSNSRIVEIPGVGDSAAMLVRDDHVNFLVVQKGNRYVKFVTTFIKDMTVDSPKLKEAEGLALKALDRIK